MHLGMMSIKIGLLSISKYNITYPSVSLLGWGYHRVGYGTPDSPTNPLPLKMMDIISKRPQMWKKI